MGCVQFEEGPDSEAEGAFCSRDTPWTLGGGRWQWPLYSMDRPLEVDGEWLRVEAAMRATADPLPLAAGQWQGGTENLTGLFLNDGSK